VNTWHVIEPGRENLVVMDRPDVLLEVVKKPAGVERRIYAVFRWVGREPKPLILRRDFLIDGPRAFERSKELLHHEWEEHEQWGEKDVLREMWQDPFMTTTEREAIRAKYRKLRQEGMERAAKLLVERAEARAKRGLRS